MSIHNIIRFTRNFISLKNGNSHPPLRPSERMDHLFLLEINGWTVFVNRLPRVLVGTTDALTPRLPFPILRNSSSVVTRGTSDILFYL